MLLQNCSEYEIFPVLPHFTIKVCRFIWLAVGQSISTTPVDTTGIINSTAEFACEVKFGTWKEMQWMFNKKVIYYYDHGEEEYPMGIVGKYTVNQDGRNFTITVNDLSYADGGRYTCSAFMSSASASLIVLGEPVLIPPKLTPMEGDTAVFACEAWFGGPSIDEISPEQFPELAIFINGNLLNDSEIQLSFTETGHTYQMQKNYNRTVDASLNRKQLKCEIRSNLLGANLTAYSTICVHYPVRDVNYSPKKDEYKVGSQISCSADGNPSPSFVWQDLTIPERLVNDSLLNITEDMTGSNEWLCTARNSIRKDTYNKSVPANFQVPKPEAIVPSENGNGVVPVPKPEAIVPSENGNDTWKTRLAVTISLGIALVTITLLILKYTVKRQPEHSQHMRSENLQVNG